MRSSSLQGILVHPPTSIPQQSSSTEDYSRVENNGVEYTIEESLEEINNNVQQEGPSVHISNPTPRNNTIYPESFGLSVPLTYRGHDSGSSDTTAMVEVPNDVLSSPSSLASRPSQHYRPSRSGPPPFGRANSQTHPNYQGLSLRIPERIEHQHEEGSSQGNCGDPPPHPVANIPGLPNMHVYHLLANHGQHAPNYRMESSIRHAAVDIGYNEATHNIRVWYSAPT